MSFFACFFSSIQAREIKIDCKPVSVKILVAPDPNHTEIAKELRKCKLDNNKMRYHPVRVRFFHLDRQTALRKLLWHENDLDTKVLVKKNWKKFYFFDIFRTHFDNDF